MLYKSSSICVVQFTINLIRSRVDAHVLLAIVGRFCGGDNVVRRVAKMGGRGCGV